MNSERKAATKALADQSAPAASPDGRVAGTADAGSLHLTVAASGGTGAAATRQLGLLLGGEEGQGLVRDADDRMRSEGILVPAQWAAMLLPGS